MSAAAYRRRMAPRATYVVSVHEPEGSVTVEDVRSGERVRVAGLADVGDQIARWRAPVACRADIATSSSDAAGSTP